MNRRGFALCWSRAFAFVKASLSASMGDSAVVRVPLWAQGRILKQSRVLTSHTHSTGQVAVATPCRPGCCQAPEGYQLQAGRSLADLSHDAACPSALLCLQIINTAGLDTAIYLRTLSFGEAWGREKGCRQAGCKQAGFSGRLQAGGVYAGGMHACRLQAGRVLAGIRTASNAAYPGSCARSTSASVLAEPAPGLRLPPCLRHVQLHPFLHLWRAAALLPPASSPALTSSRTAITCRLLSPVACPPPSHPACPLPCSLHDRLQAWSCLCTSASGASWPCCQPTSR